jgi:hypothetical protein
MPTQTNPPGLERWLVLPDEQIPAHDTKTLSAVEKYMADHRWDGVISLGDFLDFNEISRWVEGHPRKYMHSRVKLSLDLAHAILERRVKALRSRNPDCQYILIQGNHEHRIEDFLDTFPQFEGMLEVEKVLDLFQLGIKWVPFWSDPRKVFRKGKATFIHGLYTNQYHAAKHVRAYGTNVYYGHSHDVQEHSLLLGNNTHSIVAKSLGCLCDPNKMEYIKGRPQNWTQAFAVFYFLPNGDFNEYTIKIFNHRFVSPEGKLYEGE